MKFNSAEIIEQANKDNAKRMIGNRYFVLFYYDTNLRLHVYDTRSISDCHKSVASKNPSYLLIAVESFPDERSCRECCAAIRLTERIHENFQQYAKAQLASHATAAATAA